MTVTSMRVGSAAPRVTGTGDLGSILRCVAAGATFQWLRDGVAIAGETSELHIVQAADIGRRLSCLATRESNAITIPGSPPSTGFDAWTRKATITIDHTKAPASGSFRVDVDLTNHADVIGNAKLNLADIRVVDPNGNLVPIEVRTQGGQIISTNGAWSFFNNPHVVYRRQGSVNWLHVGSLTTDGSVRVANFNLDSGVVSEVTLHAQLEADDHDPASLLVMPDGTLFACYSKHAKNDTVGIKTRRTTSAGDPTIWGTERTILANLTGTKGWSYPKPIRFANGRMMIFFRAATLDHAFVYSDDDGVTWSAAVQLITNPTGTLIRPYINLDYHAGLDLVDLVYTDGHPRDVETSLWHVTVDSAGNVRKSDGTLIRNAITGGTINVTEGSQVYAFTPATGRAWGWDICRDPADSTKILAVFARFPTFQDHRYCYARWDGSGWAVTEWTAAGLSIYGPQETNEQQYSGGLFLSRVDPSVVYCSRQDGSAIRWRVWKYVTADNGLTFTGEEITPGTILKDVRPVAPKNPGVIVSNTPVAEVVWMSGVYTSYINYAMKILAYPPRAGVQIPRSVSVLVPDLGGTDLALTMYYGNPAVASVASSLDSLTPITTAGVYSISAGSANP